MFSIGRLLSKQWSFASGVPGGMLSVCIWLIWQSRFNACCHFLSISS